MNKNLKYGLIFIALLVFILTFLSIAGAIFLAMIKLDMSNATPLTLYQYYSYYGDNQELMKKMSSAIFLGFMVSLMPIVLLLMPKKQKLHGETRFATEGEIKKAGLRSKKGIILGKKNGQYLVFDGSEHVMLSAPTRSGKGIGIVVPNLLHWSDSVVVLDLKKENWNITAGFRAEHGQKCFLFDPATRDGKTHCWNPLFYISDDSNFAIDDIQSIAGMLYPDTDKGDIWEPMARKLFLACTLFLIESKSENVTIGSVYRLGQKSKKELKALIEKQQEGGNPLSETCISTFNNYLNLGDNTRTSIGVTFVSPLSLWDNLMVDTATSRNDFDFRDLRKKKMSIYLGITPDNLAKFKVLINLFFQQLIDQNIKELPADNLDLKYQVLINPDEFTAMGKVNILSSSISFIAGYGLRMLPIIQDYSQLKEVYGDEQAKTFIANHDVKIIFTPDNIDTAERISKEIGYNTVKSVSKSRNSGKGGGSRSESDQSRALMLPQEVMRLSTKKCFIQKRGEYMVLADKITYYNDPTFMDRYNPLKGFDNKNATPHPPPKIESIHPKKSKFNAIAALTKTTEIIDTVWSIDNIDTLDLEQFGIKDFEENNNPLDFAKDFIEKLTKEGEF